MEEKHDINPEEQRQQAFLAKERKQQRRHGTILLGIGLCMLPVGAVCLVWLLPTLRGAFDIAGSLITLVGGPLLFLLLGWMDYQAGLRPINQQDVQQRRQSERSRLFHLAQGRLPWYYSRPAQILFIFLGLLLLSAGIAAIAQASQFPADNSMEMLLVGIPYALIGIVLLLEAVLLLPYRRKRLPNLGASLLRQRLRMGEASSGPQTEQASGDNKE